MDGDADDNEAVNYIICPSEEEILRDQYKKILKCPFAGCGKTMSNSSSMKMHLAQTHRHGDETTLQSFNKAFSSSTKSKPKYACPVSTCCRKLGSGRYFPRLAPLREHYLSAHAEKKHSCQECGARFGNPRRLDQHVKNCGKVFKCSCGCPFRKKSAVIEHSIKNQHKLPEIIQSEFLMRQEKQTNEELNRKGPLKQLVGFQLGSVLPKSKSPFEKRKNNGPVVIAPRDKSVKANALLIVLNETKTNSTVSSAAQMNNKYDKSQAMEPGILSGVNMSGDHSLASNVNHNSSNSHKMVNGASVLNQTKSVSSGTNAIENQALPMKDMNTAKSVEQTGSLNSSKKLKRLKEAMKKFVPILKKKPAVPPAVNGETFHGYSNKSHIVNINCIQGPSFQQDDQNSLMSIQNCLQNAAMFVNRTLPGMMSPKRDENTDATVCEGLENQSIEMETKENYLSGENIGVNHEAKCQTNRKESTVISSPEKVKSFIKFASYTRDVGPSDRSELSQDRLTSIQSLRKVNRHGKIGGNITKRLKRNAELKVHSAQKKSQRATPDGFNPKLNEFCLDDLSPELLDLLRNSPEISVSNKNSQSIGETTSQHTQTPNAVAQLSFENAYSVLSTFDNSVTQTNTDDRTSVLSDAVTQTCQSNDKLTNEMSVGCKTPFSTENFVSQSSTWFTNNNETQTDNLNDLLADAFTQTRLSTPWNQASQTCMTDNNIADNHTQTNLSFDNFLVNLNFDDQGSLDASFIPDFADMCTQTNFDPAFKELLEMSSAESQTVISATSLGQAESSNCHTQTRLTFDDLFSSAFAGEEYDRELNDMYTQTIINDMFATDSFTQTQL